MNPKNKAAITHHLFNISIIAKGVDGVLETIGGILLFFISPQRIHSIIQRITQHELSKDHKDIIASYLLNSTSHLTKGVTTFAAMYLLWHGVVKIGLVTALMLKIKWAYPAAIAAFTIFLGYQMYRYSHTHAPELLVLSVLDVLVIILTWLEYKRLQSAHGFASKTR
jgi:uncharacterized membrane protein